MTQATFKTKEGETILAVVVPKGILVYDICISNHFTGLDILNGYKVYNENRNSGQSQPWFRTAKYSLQSLIESSGLTFTPEQDVLLIKVN